MKTVELRTQPRLGAAMRGVPTTVKTAVGGPSGPRGIPCAVLCPVPPPPPPAPLLFQSTIGQVGDTFVQITFSREGGSNNIPPWQITSPFVPITGQRWDGPNLLFLDLADMLIGGEVLVVPPGVTTLWARDDGGVVPAGEYPLN